MLDRQLAAISLAVRYALLEDIDRGAAIMEGITVCGASVFDEYRNCPSILAGLAYVAGIAEGKQMERNRHAAAKEGR